MGTATADRLELWDVEDLPVAVIEAATSAALTKLDELGVSPLEARLSRFNIERMDDMGALFNDDDDYIPPYEKYGVVLSHLNAHNAATDAATAVIREIAPDRERGSIAIGVSEAALADWHERGADITKAVRAA